MKTSKILFLALLFVAVGSSTCLSVRPAFADRAPDFVDFPTYAHCTGNNVRLREDPDTGSEILGKLNEFDVVIVLKKLVVDGDTWYEVDHPTKKGNAFVFGKYLEAFYEENKQSEPLHKLLMNLYLTYGYTPEKAVALYGRPRKREREVVGADSFEKITMEWNTHNVEYLDKSLTSVEVLKGNKPFGNIRIGDSAEKVERAFGKPYKKEEDTLTYQEGEMTYITFNLKDGKVRSMYYQYYYDI